MFTSQVRRERFAGVAVLQLNTTVFERSLRPLLASVGALVVAIGVYGTDAQFRAGVPESALVERIERAALEAASLASGVTT